MVKTVLKLALEKGYIKFIAPQDELVRQSLLFILKHCIDKHNSYVSISIDTPKKPRTTGKNSQNHHLNGHIQQICIETGNNFDSIKTAVKDMAIDLGYPFETVYYPICIYNENEQKQGLIKKTFKKGDKDFDFWCKEIVVPKSESECNTEECALLIEASHLLAANLGIILKE